MGKSKRRKPASSRASAQPRRPAVKVIPKAVIAETAPFEAERITTSSPAGEVARSALRRTHFEPIAVGSTPRPGVVAPVEFVTNEWFPRLEDQSQALAMSYRFTPPAGVALPQLRLVFRGHRVGPRIRDTLEPDSANTPSGATSFQVEQTEIRQ